VDLHLVVAGDDDWVLAHVGQEEVVLFRDEALMGDHEPRSAKDLVHLFVVDVLVDEDPAIEMSIRRVDDVVLLACCNHL